MKVSAYPTPESRGGNFPSHDAALTPLDTDIQAQIDYWEFEIVKAQEKIKELKNGNAGKRD